MSNNNNKIGIFERPISDSKEDYFEIESRLVNKVFRFITSVHLTQLTIALTGEWGIGKSSVINLLQKKLKDNKKSVIVNFEPLLDGKFEIADIISLFYFKLYQSLKEPAVRDVIKKCLKSVAIFSRAKITANASLDASIFGFPGAKAGGQVEYDLGKNIDDFLNLWDKEEIKNFSEQTKELNDKLKKHNLRLCVFIDEIDRLSAEYIIKFLLFCRVLESFDNLVCIVGIDYEQVIRKLTSENILGQTNYAGAQNYLDKLFQIKFHVHHNRYKKIDYGVNKLQELDKKNILVNIINTKDYNVQHSLEIIFDYLSTPRQIKKWLISLVANYTLLKYSLDKLVFMAFLAVTIKHPIVIDYMSKHTLKILGQSNLAGRIAEEYGINFPPCEDISTKIMLASLGFINESIKSKDANDNLKELREKLGVHEINDNDARKWVEKYLESSRYLINLFVEGFASEEQVCIYQKFFSEEAKNIDAVIKIFIEGEDKNTRLIAEELAETVAKEKYSIKTAPKIYLLNRLWESKVNDNYFPSNPYKAIILFSLRKLPIEQVISESLLAMSESHLCRVLHIFNISNQNSSYNLNSFKNPFKNSSKIKNIECLCFNEIGITDFTQETIQNILENWIEKVEADLSSNETSTYSQPLLINVFYRYIQWSLSLGKDHRKQLADFVVNYLQDINVTNNSSKQEIKMMLSNERKKFSNQVMAMDRNPDEILFDNNEELIRLTSE